MQKLKLLLCVLSFSSVALLPLFGQMIQPSFQVTSSLDSMVIQQSSLTYKDMFVSAAFDDEGKNLVVETKQEVHSVLLYNSVGLLEYVIPIGGRQVTIGREMFGEDNSYRLAFNFKNIEILQESVLVMK